MLMIYHSIYRGDGTGVLFMRLLRFLFLFLAVRFQKNGILVIAPLTSLSLLSIYYLLTD